ncbi:hypothetical protein B5X24_HaOG216578 [Helicoverpa armigera]|nr:hypothetical protein B5X24_HaOG216578 [Helicoverpa armigera]
MSEFFGPWTDKEDGDEEVVEETVETITTTTTRKQIPSVSPYEQLALIVTRVPDELLKYKFAKLSRY